MRQKKLVKSNVHEGCQAYSGRTASVTNNLKRENGISSGLRARLPLKPLTSSVQRQSLPAITDNSLNSRSLGVFWKTWFMSLAQNSVEICIFKLWSIVKYYQFLLTAIPSFNVWWEVGGGHKWKVLCFNKWQLFPHGIVVEAWPTTFAF